MERTYPITVFTGYLGAGKTTIIMNLIRQVPEGYKCIWLKNEFGDVKVDSEMARESNIEVQEMLNGCLCCNLVGKMNTALQEIVSKYPETDRIIIETSGSAFPGPIAWEIRRMGLPFKLDGIITVIDAVNFKGYEDKSITARLQVKDTDLILINKHELVSERQLESVLDDVYELNEGTPKVKCSGREGVPYSLVFGLDSKLFETQEHAKSHEKDVHDYQHHHKLEVDLIHVNLPGPVEKAVFDSFLASIPPDDFYRVKGVISVVTEISKVQYMIFNYVFGKFDYHPLTNYEGQTHFTCMGQQLKLHQQRIAQALAISNSCVVLTHQVHK